MTQPTGLDKGQNAAVSPPEAQGGGQQTGPATLPVGCFERFLKYRGEAYCHSHEGLFMLIPESEPSIGYKLQQVFGTTKPILDGGEEISEDTAIHVIFHNLNKGS